jgi:hypothetical protein
MGAKRRDETRDFVETAGSDRYRDSRFGFQETMRSGE